MSVREDVRTILERWVERFRRTPEEAVSSIVETLTSEGKIKMFSEIYPYEDDTIALMHIIATRYGIDWLKTYNIEKLILRVSMGRGGRRELVGLVKSYFSKEEKPKVEKPRFTFLFRKKKEGGETGE